MVAHNCLSNYSCYRGPNAQFWPLWAAGTQVVHKHTFWQNSHTYNYKNIKIYMSYINVYQAVFWRFNWNVKLILTPLFSIWELFGNDSDNAHMVNNGVRIIPRVQTSRAWLTQICLQFRRQRKTTNDTFPSVKGHRACVSSVLEAKLLSQKKHTELLMVLTL